MPDTILYEYHTSLGISAVLTSPWYATGQWREVLVSAYGAEASAASGMVVQETLDNAPYSTSTTVHNTPLAVTLAADTYGPPQVIELSGKAFRFTFTQGGTAGQLDLIVKARR